MSHNFDKDFDYCMKEWLNRNPQPMYRMFPLLAKSISNKEIVMDLLSIIMDMNSNNKKDDKEADESKSKGEKKPPLFLICPPEFLLIEEQMITQKVLKKNGQFFSSKALSNMQCAIGIAQYLHESPIMDVYDEDGVLKKHQLSELVDFLNYRWKMKISHEVYRHSDKYTESAMRIPYIKEHPVKPKSNKTKFKNK